MAGNIPTDYRVGGRICAQDGQCGEVVAEAEGGVELKLDNGDGISVPTENLDHATLRIPVEKIEEKYPSEIFYNYNDGGVVREARHLLPTIEQYLAVYAAKREGARELHGEEMTMRLPVFKRDKMFVDSLLKGLKEFTKKAHAGEEGLRGEEIRMVRPTFEEATELFLKSSPKATITPEQMELLREFIITKTKALKIKE